MKKIKLTQNQTTKVDDEDFKRLSAHKWYAKFNPKTKSFYAMRKVRKDNKQTSLMISREIMEHHNYVLKGKVVDHINHDTLDNRKKNLRVCTVSQNNKNRGKTRFSSSGKKGVYWSKEARKWRAQITVDRKQIYLGLYLTKEKAYKAYIKACIKYHGEYASY